jgi:hypothetical protein
LGYFDNESDDFKSISSYLNNKIEEAKMIKLSNQSNDILTAIQQDPDQLYELLCHSNYGSNRFYSKPILQFIPMDSFINLIIKIPNKTKRIILNVLHHRYEHSGLNQPLKPELEWLEDIAEKLELHLSLIKKSTPSTLNLNGIKTNIKNAAKKLREA